MKYVCIHKDIYVSVDAQFNWSVFGEGWGQLEEGEICDLCHEEHVGCFHRDGTASSDEDALRRAMDAVQTLTYEVAKAELGETEAKQVVRWLTWNRSGSYAPWGNREGFIKERCTAFCDDFNDC